MKVFADLLIFFLRELIVSNDKGVFELESNR